MADTDEDGIDDTTDPAPQINPARWGFDINGDDVFDETDLATLRSELEAAGGDTSDFPTTVVEFQRRLMDFDQDNDGFLEAPDSNGDGFPDFTRYNEATLEQAFGIDFSNDGTLEDGFDVGGLGLGPAGPNDSRAESATRDQTLFGTFRIARDASGLISGDGWVDLVDSIGVLIPSDNCPTSSNPNQLDFDGDGLGDTCDADLDNDGVPNALDPVEQNPTAQTAPIAPLCGFGMLQGLIGCLIGMSGMRRVTRRRR
ncbi:MAG: hypothetical protein D6744_02995 [Planctomycetota bacterium]|nr:MAG: hypothetical protein D6744_02995 [Planctomycetota bacterium]